MKRLIFITGLPGVGKTTVLLRTIEALKTLGYNIGGMLSREVREADARVGFEIMDLATGQKGWLAHVNQPIGPKVSRYRVNLNDLNTIGANAIRNAVMKAQIIAVDEIGPMELFSSAFKGAVLQAVNSRKPLLGTIHHGARDPLIDLIKARSDTEIIKVTYENREHLHNFLIDKIIQLLNERHLKTV